jgi:DNA primase
VQKLFRFTDHVVFSFDGDAAGRRAAARALEAALPHATDLRSVRFLFLPPEHDPDSYVRELGPEAFDHALAEAVPLSRQLQALAAEGCELATAEGRSRMLAQARPLWQALPDGALKRQLLPELAAQARLEAADLAQLWGTARAAARPAADRSGPVRLLRPGSLRVAPAGPADVALRLLLQHSDWWERLAPDDQQLLHELDPPYGEVARWIEAQLMEHGPLTWSHLNDAMAEQPWAERARGWVRAGLGDEQHSFEELQRSVSVLLESLLAQEAAAIAAEPKGADDLNRLKEIRAQITALKTARAPVPAR